MHLEPAYLCATNFDGEYDIHIEKMIIHLGIVTNVFLLLFRERYKVELPQNRCVPSEPFVLSFALLYSSP